MSFQLKIIFGFDLNSMNLGIGPILILCIAIGFMHIRKSNVFNSTLKDSFHPTITWIPFNPIDTFNYILTMILYIRRYFQNISSYSIIAPSPLLLNHCKNEVTKSIFLPRHFFSLFLNYLTNMPINILYNRFSAHNTNSSFDFDYYLFLFRLLSTIENGKT